MPDAPSLPIFRDWSPAHTAGWANSALRIGHRLHEDPLFSLDALADLIDRYPREHYALVHMGAQKERRLWREGEINGVPGRAVVEAIAQGRMWLNLRNVSMVDPRYREVLDRIFEEVRHNVPGYETYARTCGILISSPNAQVYYHMDLPGQSLWQMHGRKRVYLYPDRAPFLSAEQLERIALYEVEVDIPYEPWYDQHATVFEIGGGEMLHWPLNAPHRVENLDCLNVSMTTEYWTDHIRRRQMLNMANGILRHTLGVAPSSAATSGPGFWAKAALQAGVRRSGLLRKARKSRRPVAFRLDPSRPGHVIDLDPSASRP
ncbi:MAG: cupin-like domain-containing protein [Hyphomicrobiaceae bacterium]|nr:cupin-like domain-containing protein [Hyphomicrobiaceae bacterium]